jgi:hypothetical protein
MQADFLYMYIGGRERERERGREKHADERITSPASLPSQSQLPEDTHKLVGWLAEQRQFEGGKRHAIKPERKKGRKNSKRIARPRNPFGEAKK